MKALTLAIVLAVATSACASRTASVVYGGLAGFFVMNTVINCGDGEAFDPEGCRSGGILMATTFGGAAVVSWLRAPPAKPDARIEELRREGVRRRLQVLQVQARDAAAHRDCAQVQDRASRIAHLDATAAENLRNDDAAIRACFEAEENSMPDEPGAP